jgi:taurine dioxygenase
MAYQQLPDDLRDQVEDLVAIHSAALGYAPDGAYGEDDQALGRSMKILPSERARESYSHPLIRTHRENGSKALFSSAAYITGFYKHRWEAGMVVMWDNRSLLHAATGGYDGHDRLLHRTTIADTQF